MQRRHGLGAIHLGGDKYGKIPSGLGNHELKTNGVDGNRSKKRYR